MTPVRPSDVEITEMVNEIRAGNPLIVKSPAIKYAGRTYFRGEAVKLTGTPADDKLIQSGHLLTSARLKAWAAQADRQKRLRDVLEPARVALNAARTRHGKARAILASAEAAYQAARAEAEAAASQLAREEQAYTELVAHEDA